jgi:hypothetical protein
MIALPHKEFVTADDKGHEVMLCHEYKSVWVAAGAYDGRWFSVSGGSHSAALAHWREAAADKGNVRPWLPRGGTK